jgi:hypothetical protein
MWDGGSLHSMSSDGSLRSNVRIAAVIASPSVQSWIRQSSADMTEMFAIRCGNRLVARVD